MYPLLPRFDKGVVSRLSNELLNCDFDLVIPWNDRTKLSNLDKLIGIWIFLPFGCQMAIKCIFLDPNDSLAGYHFLSFAITRNMSYYPSTMF